MMMEIIQQSKTMSVEDIINNMYLAVKSSIEEKIGDIMEDDDNLGNRAIDVLKKVIKGERLDMMSKDRKIVKLLVEREILYYDPLRKRISPHTKLHEKAVRELLGE